MLVRSRRDFCKDFLKSVTAFGNNRDANNRGTLIPTAAVAQYGAVLAQGFGVGAASLPRIFPKIGNFSSTPPRTFLG